jgi:putative DNA primase/helicase
MNRLNIYTGDGTPQMRNGKPSKENHPRRAPRLVTLADVDPTEVEWLWPGRIALGKLTLLVSDPGEGKSFLSLDIASRVTRGVKWPDGSGYASLGNVVLLSAEDDLSDTVRPRLDAACADVSRVVALEAVVSHDTKGEHNYGVDLARDLDMVEQAIAVDGCKLLIVDPVSAYMGDTDTHKNSEVRRVLAPLSALAAKYMVAVLAVHHFRKGGEGNAKHRVTGSLAFIAASRAAWTVAPDRTDTAGKRKLFLCIKNNIGPDQSGLSFVLTTKHADDKIPHVEWLAGEVTTTADEALAEPRKTPGPDAEERKSAEGFLLAALADGPRQVKDIESEARDAHCISKRTLERARKALAVEAFQPEIPGPWFIRLAHSASPPPTPPLNACLPEPGGLGGLAY